MAAKENLDLSSEDGSEALEIEKPEFLLKEWNPQSNLLSKIPMKAQKGFTTLDLNLTCIGALPEFLVLGTNVGLLYWYNRKTGTLERLKIENNTTPVTCISVVSSVDYMLAAGNKNGIINIFQIPKHFDIDDRLLEINGNKDTTMIPKKKQVQIFTVKDMHTCSITALEWSTNGIKLFSGDTSGVVTLTEIDYDIGQSKSIPLLDEKYEIVQLSYSQLNLVISSTFRTIIYSTENKQSIKIGSQDRKFLGHFGAVLTPGLYNKNRKIYTVRPGLRIWVAGLDGTVQNTIIFKDLLGNPHLNIPILNPMTNKSTPQDIQFGIIYNFLLGKYLVTWYNDILYVIDPENIQIIGTCSEFKSILSVAVCQDELFILETGRNIIRISGQCDPYLPLSSISTSLLLSSSSSSSSTSTSTSNGLLDRSSSSSEYFIPDIMTNSFSDFHLPDKPLNFLATKFMETSRALPKFMETSRALPKFNTSIFHTIKNVIEADLDIQDGQFTVLPQIITLKETNIPNITIETQTEGKTLNPSSPTTNINFINHKKNFDKDKEKYDRISKQSYEDVVLAEFKPENSTIIKKTGGKRKKYQHGKEKDDTISDTISLSSHYSSNSESDITSSTTTLNINKSNNNNNNNKRKTSTDSNCSSNISTIPMGPSCSSENNSPIIENKKINDNDNDYNNFIPSLADVRFYNEKIISSKDLESKEQMLAKLLNWTDLLPTTTSSSSSHHHLLEITKENNEMGFINDGKSIEPCSSIKTLTPEDIDIDSSLIDGSSSTTLVDEFEEEDEEEDKTTLLNTTTTSSESDENNSCSHETYNDSSMDIYKKYNSHHQNIDNLSLTSTFSFGPPSGSSNMYYTTEESRNTSLSGNSIDEYHKNTNIHNIIEPSSSSSSSSISYYELSGSGTSSRNDGIESSLMNLNLKQQQQQDMIVEGIGGNDDWYQYKLPMPTISISVCEKYIICIDTTNKVYYSNTFGSSNNIYNNNNNLCWIKTDYSGTQISISPNGNVVWRIDNKKILYSLTFPSTQGPFTIEGEWIQIHENVKYVTVDENYGWIIKTDGSVYICKRIKNGLPIPKPYFELVPTSSWVITQLCIYKNNVWALTNDGKILYRTRISVVTPIGEEWIEIKIISSSYTTIIPTISCIGIGPNDTLWLVDIHNKIYFINNNNNIHKIQQQQQQQQQQNGLLLDGSGSSVGSSSSSSSNDIENEKYLWYVIIADYIFQHGNSNSYNTLEKHWRNRLVDSLRPGNLTSFIYQTKSIPLLCTSMSSIWFTLSGTSSIYVNKKSITGHRWESFSIISGLKTMKWADIFAGSIYLQHGFLWLMNSKRKLYYCYPNDGKLYPLDLPQVHCSYADTIVHVASAPEALWVLTSKGNIYGRCNMTSKNELGIGWERIQLSPLENVRMVHISCGSEVVWACDSNGNIYMRLGSLDPPCTNDISPAWVQVDGRPPSFLQGSIFTKVYVGTTGHMVWALDSSKNIFAREAVFPDLPIGTDWVHVSGIEAISLAISDSAVWALSPKGEIFKRYGITKTNFVGEYWRKIPGTATAITASLCDQIWILDSTGYVQKHFQETQKFTSTTTTTTESESESSINQTTKILKTIDSEDNDDWEFI